MAYPFRETVSTDSGSSFGNASQITAGDRWEDSQAFVNTSVKIGHLLETLVREFFGSLDGPNLLD